MTNVSADFKLCVVDGAVQLSWSSVRVQSATQILAKQWVHIAFTCMLSSGRYECAVFINGCKCNTAQHPLSVCAITSPRFIEPVSLLPENLKARKRGRCENEGNVPTREFWLKSTSSSDGGQPDGSRLSVNWQDDKLRNLRRGRV